MPPSIRTPPSATEDRAGPRRPRRRWRSGSRARRRGRRRPPCPRHDLARSRVLGGRVQVAASRRQPGRSGTVDAESASSDGGGRPRPTSARASGSVGPPRQEVRPAASSRGRGARPGRCPRRRVSAAHGDPRSGRPSIGPCGEDDRSALRQRPGARARRRRPCPRRAGVAGTSDVGDHHLRTPGRQAARPLRGRSTWTEVEVHPPPGREALGRPAQASLVRHSRARRSATAVDGRSRRPRGSSASWSTSAGRTSGSDTVSAPIPTATWGVYVASDSAASLALAMPSATTPATVAATAATAGTVRVRCRAASRTAYRATRGNRRARRARTATTTGTTRIMPSTETTAEPAIRRLPPPTAEVVARAGPGRRTGDADARAGRAPSSGRARGSAAGRLGGRRGRRRRPGGRRCGRARRRPGAR